MYINNCHDDQCCKEARLTILLDLSDLKKLIKKRTVPSCSKIIKLVPCEHLTQSLEKHGPNYCSTCGAKNTNNWYKVILAESRDEYKFAEQPDDEFAEQPDGSGIPNLDIDKSVDFGEFELHKFDHHNYGILLGQSNEDIDISIYLDEIFEIKDVLLSNYGIKEIVLTLSVIDCSV